MKNSAFNRLREEEREVRKQLIIEATLTLLEKKSFDQIGMRDIAAEAGISPASLYRYFPGQTDLLMETFLSDIENKLMYFHQGITNGTIKDTTSFAIDIVDLLLENEATFQMMSYMMIKADISENLLKKFNFMMKNFFERINTIFKISGIDLDTNTLVHVFFSSLAGIVMTFRNYPSEDKNSLKEHIRKLAVISAYAFTQKNVSDFIKHS